MPITCLISIRECAIGFRYTNRKYAIPRSDVHRTSYRSVTWTRISAVKSFQEKNVKTSRRRSNDFVTVRLINLYDYLRLYIRFELEQNRSMPFYPVKAKFSGKTVSCSKSYSDSKENPGKPKGYNLLFQ